MKNFIPILITGLLYSTLVLISMIFIGIFISLIFNTITISNVMGWSAMVFVVNTIICSIFIYKTNVPYPQSQDHPDDRYIDDGLVINKGVMILTEDNMRKGFDKNNIKPTDISVSKLPISRAELVLFKGEHTFTVIKSRAPIITATQQKESTWDTKIETIWKERQIDYKIETIFEESQIVHEKWIGRPIYKKSGKPFKSGGKKGIALEITINKFSGKKAFKMDDGSVVDCSICSLSKMKPFKELDR